MSAPGEAALDAAPLPRVASTVPEDAAPAWGAGAVGANRATAVGLVLAGDGTGANDGSSNNEHGGFEELHGLLIVDVSTGASPGEDQYDWPVVLTLSWNVQGLRFDLCWSVER